MFQRKSKSDILVETQTYNPAFNDPAFNDPDDLRLEGPGANAACLPTVGVRNHGDTSFEDTFFEDCMYSSQGNLGGGDATTISGEAPGMEVIRIDAHSPPRFRMKNSFELGAIRTSDMVLTDNVQASPFYFKGGDAISLLHIDSASDMPQNLDMLEQSTEAGRYT
eukprot:gene16468-19550_t